MALALKRIRRRDLTFVVTGGGTITAIRNLKTDAKIGTYDVTAGTATYRQKVTGLLEATGSYEMFLGTEGIAPVIGDSVTALSASVGADEVGQADLDGGTNYGILKVTSVGHNYPEEAAIITVGFESGFLS